MPLYDGITADTFLHIFDAWIEWAMENMSRREVDAHELAFRDFTEYCGDRFSDADDLARAIGKWQLARGGRTKKAKRARKVLDDILEMWRAAES